MTKRPHQLENVIRNYEQQHYARKKLLLITHSASFDTRRTGERLASVADASVLHADEARSLGSCLNLALEISDTRYIAKFDDDDWYGAAYLGDMLMAHDSADAAIVGKHSYFALLEDMNLHVLRFPGREYTYTSFVSGATLVIDLNRIGGAQFADLTGGEDSGLLENCLKRGESIFSADRFNYLHRRGRHNTWNPPLDAFLLRSLPVDPRIRACTIEL